MKNILLFLTLLYASVLSSVLASANETILIEENGFLVFETESTAAVEDWQFTNQIPGYTGTGYFVWNGDTVTNIKKAGRGTLTYHFTIINAGNYELRWRSRIAMGNSKKDHNDSWVRFATGENVSGERALDGWTKAYQNKIEQWTWQTSTVDHNPHPIRQYFSAGDHTIEISARSAGHAIDRIALFQYDQHEFSDEAFDTAAAAATITATPSLQLPVTDSTAESTNSPATDINATSPAPTNETESSTLEIGAAESAGAGALYPLSVVLLLLLRLPFRQHRKCC